MDDRASGEGLIARDPDRIAAVRGDHVRQRGEWIVTYRANLGWFVYWVVTLGVFLSRIFPPENPISLESWMFVCASLISGAIMSGDKESGS